MEKNKNLNIRIPKELHDKIKNEAIKKSVQTNELVTVSEIIRELLEIKFGKNEK